MNRKTFAIASLAILVALTLVGRAATAEVRAVRRIEAICAPVRAAVVIPDNVLTGHGALATSDGAAHF